MKREKKAFEYLNLLAMLREIDTEKNSPEDLRVVLNYIAEQLEKYVDLMKGE